LDSHTQTSGIPVPLPACNDLDAAMTAICREHLAGQNVNERLGAVSALARSAGDQGGIELLVTALSDRSWRVRSAAYDALHSLNERAVPFLIGALQSDDDRIVWRAACLLGSLRADAAVDPLIALLVKNTSVCTVAVWALGEIGSPKAAEPLLALLKSNDTEIAGSAARALAKIGCPA
jgi:HEAT repeat protein